MSILHEKLKVEVKEGVNFKTSAIKRVVSKMFKGNNDQAAVLHIFVKSSLVFATLNHKKFSMALNHFSGMSDEFLTALFSPLLVVPIVKGVPDVAGLDIILYSLNKEKCNIEVFLTAKLSTVQKNVALTTKTGCENGKIGDFVTTKDYTNISSGKSLTYILAKSPGLAVTMNENFDRDVKDSTTNYIKDISKSNKALQSSLVGNSVIIPFDNKELIKGRKKGLWTCQFGSGKDYCVAITNSKICRTYLIKTKKKRGFHDVMGLSTDWLKQSKGVYTGMVHFFCLDTSAGVLLGHKNKETLFLKDCTSFFNKKEEEKRNREKKKKQDADIEGSDDMPGHIKSALLGTSVSLPIERGKLVMGNEQAVFLGEYCENGGTRVVVVIVEESVDSVERREKELIIWELKKLVKAEKKKLKREKEISQLYLSGKIKFRKEIKLKKMEMEKMKMEKNKLEKELQEKIGELEKKKDEEDEKNQILNFGGEKGILVGIKIFNKKYQIPTCLKENVPTLRHLRHSTRMNIVGCRVSSSRGGTLIVFKVHPGLDEELEKVKKKVFSSFGNLNSEVIFLGFDQGLEIVPSKIWDKLRMTERNEDLLKDQVQQMTRDQERLQRDQERMQRDQERMKRDQERMILQLKKDLEQKDHKINQLEEVNRKKEQKYKSTQLELFQQIQKISNDQSGLRANTEKQENELTLLRVELETKNNNEKELKQKISDLDETMEKMKLNFQAIVNNLETTIAKKKKEVSQGRENEMKSGGDIVLKKEIQKLEKKNKRKEAALEKEKQRNVQKNAELEELKSRILDLEKEAKELKKSNKKESPPSQEVVQLKNVETEDEETAKNEEEGSKERAEFRKRVDEEIENRIAEEKRFAEEDDKFLNDNIAADEEKEKIYGELVSQRTSEHKSRSEQEKKKREYPSPEKEVKGNYSGFFTNT